MHKCDGSFEKSVGLREGLIAQGDLTRRMVIVVFFLSSLSWESHVYLRGVNIEIQLREGIIHRRNGDERVGNARLAAKKMPRGTS